MMMLRIELMFQLLKFDKGDHFPDNCFCSHMAKWVGHPPSTAVVKCLNLTICIALHSLKRRLMAIFPAWMQKCS